MNHYQLKKQSSSNRLFKAILGVIDLYATPVQLQINQNEKHVSTIGILSSIFLFVICGIMFGQNLEKILNKRSPSVIMSEYMQKETPVIQLYFYDKQSYQLEKHNFTLAIVLVNMTSFKALKPQQNIFSYNIKICHRTRQQAANGQINATLDCRQLQFEQCDQIRHFQNIEYKSYFSTMNISNMVCINQNQQENEDLKLQGYFTSNEWTFLQIQVNECKNNSNFSQCASKEFINQYLLNGNYVTYTFDNLIDQSNFASPFNPIVKLWYTTFSNQSSKTIYTYYSQAKVTSDIGLVSEELDEKLSLFYSSTDEYTELSNSQFLVNQIITLDSRIKVYRRNYQKIQDVIVNTGGILNTIHLFIFILVTPIIRLLMNLNIIDSLFTFQLDTSKIILNDQMKRQGNLFKNTNKSLKRLDIQFILYQLKVISFLNRLYLILKKVAKIKKIL